MGLQISERAQNMPSSPIRKLARYADAAKRNGIHVYHLNIGQPDIKTPQCALEAARNIGMDILSYSPSQGNKSLRTKLVSYYAEYGIDLSPDEIIITAGGSEAIQFAYMACLNPGDEIIVTDPSYANYMAFAISAGAVVKSVKTSIEDGFRLPSVEAFEEQITPKTKAILICNPNNPTGYLYSRKEMRQIRDLVKKHNLYLISDEVYREFI
ncbi:MAG: aminotransferase class I/II-fold pyridoxal phosphate-dependent enzyme, partial [Bacteroidaceae bacterium]